MKCINKKAHSINRESMLKQMMEEIPEVTFNARRLVEKISDNIESLLATEPRVGGTVTDDQSAIMNTVSELLNHSTSSDVDWVLFQYFYKKYLL